MINKVDLQSCLRDFVVTLLLMLFTFTCWPFLLKGWVDAWPLRILFVALITFIESLIVNQKFFWLWIIITIFGADLACSIGQELFLLSPYSSGNFSIGFKDIFSFYYIIGDGYLNLIFSFPFILIAFIARKKRLYGILVSLVLLLSLFAGSMFTDSYYKNSIASRETIRYTIFLLTCIAVSFSIWTNYVYNEIKNVRKKLFLQWISIALWLLAGIIPGVIGLGWKYSIFTAILPPVAIYYFFKSKSQSL